MDRSPAQYRFFSALCRSCVFANRCPSSGRADACEEDADPQLLTPNHPDAAAHIAVIRSLDVNQGAWIQQKSHTLPPYITQIQPRTLVKEFHRNVVAVGLKDIVSASGRSVTMGTTLRKRLGLHDGATIIVLASGQDPLISNTHANLSSILSSLKACDFDMISALPFSIYFDGPPFTSHIHLRLNLSTFVEFAEAGIESFPFFGWRYESDITFLGDWLKSHPGVRFVALDFQDARAINGWSALRRDFQLLVETCPGDTRFLVAGVASAKRIIDLFSITDRIHIVNQEPFMRAITGKGPWDWPRSKILEDSVSYYEDICRQALTAAVA